MKGNFDDNNAQVRRLLEALGGSADAYEPPREESTPKPVGEKKPNPFLSAEPPDHGLVVEEPEGGSPGKPDILWSGTLPESERNQTGESDYPNDCATGLEGLDVGEPHGIPIPLDESYVYHGLSVECGELNQVQKGFSFVLDVDKPRSVQLDSGLYPMSKLPEGGWVLVDPVKGKRYVQETGNLGGHRKVGRIFIWVMGLEDLGGDFGYIHQGCVFVKKP